MEVVNLCKEYAPYVLDAANNWLFYHYLITLRQLHINNRKDDLIDFYNKGVTYIKTNNVLLRNYGLIRKLDYMGIVYLPLYFRLLKLICVRMSEQPNKQIAKNTIMLYIRTLLIMAVSLYTIRIVLKTLGIEDYGIYNVVGGVVVALSVINASLSGASSRFIAFAIGKKDSELLKSISPQ